MKNVVILNFSTRINGNCANIANKIGVHHMQTNVLYYVIDSRIGPCGNCDYECLRPEEKCPNVTHYQCEVMEAVMNADITYMILPNYCGFPCANFLAFNERSVGYFNMNRLVMDRYMNARKRFIIISNSENQMFDQAMRQQVRTDPDVLYLKSSKYGKRSIAGDILESEAALAELNVFLDKE